MNPYTHPRRAFHTPVNSSVDRASKPFQSRLDHAVDRSDNTLVRPRAIPKRIWLRIKAIAQELHLTIPDTLNLLADLYEEVKKHGHD